MPNRLSRLSSQWPPSPTAVLKAVLAVAATVGLSMMSWLVLESISSQVVQAKHGANIEAVRVSTAGIEAKVAEHEVHDRKIDEALHGINLTQQRLADMLAHHDADIEEIKDEARHRRRRRDD